MCTESPPLLFAWQTMLPSSQMPAHCMHLGRRDKYGKYGSGIVQYFFNEPSMCGFEFSKQSDNTLYERSHWYSGGFEGIKNIIIQASHYEIEGEP